MLRSIVQYCVFTLACCFPLLSSGQFGYMWGSELEGYLGTTHMVADDQNNVYMTGNIQGTVDFDPSAGSYTLSEEDGPDIFVCKYDYDGNLVWAHVFANTFNNFGEGIAITPTGDVLVTGYFGGTIDFNPDTGTEFNLTATGSINGFVLKLTPDGDMIWAKVLEGSGWCRPEDVIADGGDNVYVAGSYSSEIDMDPGSGVVLAPSSAGSQDIFILKLNPDGDHEWSQGFGGAGWDEANEMEISNSDKLIISGKFEYTVNFDATGGSDYQFAVGDHDCFVMKLDFDGNFFWSSAFGGTGEERNYGLALDDADDIFVTGSFKETCDFDPGAGEYNISSGSPTQPDIYILKLNIDGNMEWAKSIGNDTTNYPHGIYLDEGNHIYIGGTFFETMDFDPDGGGITTASTGARDIFLLKLNHAGEYLTHFNFWGPSWELGDQFTLGTAGNILLFGTYQSTFDFDPTEGVDLNTPTGSYANYLVRLCSHSYSTISETVCGSYESPSGIIYETSGTYNDTIPSAVVCDSIITIELTINPDPDVDAGADWSVCEGDTVVLSASGALSYSWDNDVDNGVEFVPDVGTGTYVVTGIDANGCSGMDSLIITVNEGPDLVVSADQIFCLGDSVHLDASGAASYTWDAGASTLSTYSLFPTSDSTIKVVGAASTGCEADETIELTLDDPALVSAGEDIQTCPSETINLVGTGGGTYLWTGADISPNTDQILELIAMETNYYYLEVTTPQSCVYNDSVLVEILEGGECPATLTYNAITPNGDGSNDHLEIQGIENFPTNEVRIFNRWGDIVYSASGYNNDGVKWEGTNQFGRLVKQGTYYIVVEVDGTQLGATYVQVMY